MTSLSVHGAAVALVAGGWAGDGPVATAQVVKVQISRGSLADGLETFFVSCQTAPGWQLRSAWGPLPGAGVRYRFLVDDQPASTCGVHPSPAVTQTDAAGNRYQVYETGVGATAWLLWDETEKAKTVAVRLTITATDGKRTLKTSTVTAETR